MIYILRGDRTDKKQADGLLSTTKSMIELKRAHNITAMVRNTSGKLHSLILHGKNTTNAHFNL
jgi:hypothetical protein